MKRLLAFLGFVAFLSPSSAPAVPDDDVAQLRGLEARFVNAMNDKNVDSVMAAYAPGDSLFVFDVVGPPGVHFGWDQYRDAFRKMFASIRGPLQLTLSDLHIDVSGDMAYSRSLQRVSGVRNKGGKPFAYTVRVSDVYRKIGGKWLIVQEHLSLPIERDSLAPMLNFTIPAQ